MFFFSDDRNAADEGDRLAQGRKRDAAAADRRFEGGPARRRRCARTTGEGKEQIL